jgi:probable F420-dependent oxidoreductase
VSAAPRLGIAYPQAVIGSAPETLAAFAAVAEQDGFAHLALYDHVLGADRAVWPELVGPWRAEHEFHDVFVALGFLASATSSIELSTQVLILPQRQAAAVARQAASVAQLCGNRLRLGIGVGWNPVEFQALGADFGTRGKLVDEQLDVMTRLLTGEIVDYRGRWHTLDHVAINPVPNQAIPLWFGGTVSKTFERVARHGDGWITLYDRPGDTVQRRLDRLRRAAVRQGREPDQIGVDVWISMGGTTAADWRHEIEGWRGHGVTHLTLNTGFRALHHEPIESNELQAHVDGARRFRDAVEDLLCD